MVFSSPIAEMAEADDSIESFKRKLLAIFGFSIFVFVFRRQFSVSFFFFSEFPPILSVRVLSKPIVEIADAVDIADELRSITLSIFVGCL